ncbi:DUF3768 domain-containing protein [Tumidithrix helvetica PCC 7403]|uniref:DUF3768 domain-containing protein n=1 Tax=Tumidithrix helvetica TaxID=3457545 RepID=UPI003C93FB2B
MTTSTQNKIAELNDRFRKDFSLGMLQLSNRVSAMDASKLTALTEAIANFDNFTQDNDPWGERDFGSIELEGDLLFWKIDYYDLQLEMHSEDPSDSSKTHRVMSVMFANEY